MRRTLPALLVIVLIATGCGGPVESATPVPTPSLTASPTFSPQTTLTAPPTPAASPTATATLPATPSPTPAITDLVPDVQELPARYTTGTELYNTGTSLVWGSGRKLWIYDLQGTPQNVYTGASGDRLGPVAGSAAGYLFVEKKAPTSVSNIRWWLYFLPVHASAPILVDRYTNGELGPPDIAINDTYIAWIVPTGTYTDTTLNLRVARIDQPKQTQTLLAYNPDDKAIGGVSLWHDELWYDISTTGPGGTAAHVEMIDLLHPDAAPVAYGADVHAYMPAANDQVIAWKGGDPTLAAGNPAPPFVYWRDTGAYQQLDFPTAGDAAQIQYPTVGNRFVAWWDVQAQQFYVYDLAERALRRIVEYDPHGPRYLVPAVRGNLLSWVYFANDQAPGVTQWAQLPQ
jgi:hypothetical protein